MFPVSFIETAEAVL